MNEPRMLVLMVPRERRDDVVDALLGREELSGFTLLPALGYSRENSHLSVPEQVVGYRDFDRFEVLLDAVDLPRCWNSSRKAAAASGCATGSSRSPPRATCPSHRRHPGRPAGASVNLL